MKKHLTSILLIVILLAGVGLLLYPSVANWWNSFHQSRAIAAYDEALAQLDTTQMEQMLEVARAYNRRLFERGNMSMMSEEEYAEYLATLDVTGTGIMGYLEIPSITVSLPIYHTTEEPVLQIAVGHLEETSLPVGGENTHAVLSGHRGLPSAKLFTNLDRLVTGDTFSITVLHERLTYMVDQIRIVLPEETDDLAIKAGKDYVTLVTCTPYGINSHRLLVRAHRVDTIWDNEDRIVPADATQINPTTVALCIGVPTIVLSMLVAMFWPKKRKRTIDDLLEGGMNDEEL